MPDRLASDPPQLARTMGLFALTLYGIGDMLGSGIYALIGRVAGEVGNLIWLAFLVSMVAAALTGLSYASLGARYPRAAGAAYITHRAYGVPLLSYVVGLAVMASGLTSMAVQANAFAGYFTGMAGLPAEPWVLKGCVIAFILLLTVVNFLGMRESTTLNMLCTTVEVSGLLIVIAAGLRFWGGVDYLELPASEGGPAPFLPVLLSGSVLTFYAFIGFEDMINVVEEVKDPRRTFPRAVVLALLGATVLYVMVSLSAVSALPHAELAKSRQPLVDVVARAWPAFPPVVFSAISLFAITNTALLNYIMGSRLAYGMARQGLLPAAVGAVHPVRRTPNVAIAILMAIVLGLAMIGDLRVLAQATSALLLSVFVLVNAALVVLKCRKSEPPGPFEVPLVVPIGGVVICLLLLTRVEPQARGIALLLAAGAAALYFLVRPRAVTEETIAAAEEA